MARDRNIGKHVNIPLCQEKAKRLSHFQLQNRQVIIDNEAHHIRKHRTILKEYSHHISVGSGIGMGNIPL